MGDAFIVRRGGITDAFAVIAVTYPAGSVCTCTKGSKTLRAKDTSGSFLFLIPEAGTWIASCTDGTNTARRTVVIDRQYQGEYLELAYQFYIFKSGLGFQNGYAAKRFTYAGGVSSEDITGIDSLNVPNADTGVGIVGSFRTGNYTSANARIKQTGGTTGTEFQISQNQQNDTHMNNAVAETQMQMSAINTTVVLSIPISALVSTENYYLGFDNRYRPCYIYDIWLE